MDCSSLEVATVSARYPLLTLIAAERQGISRDALTRSVGLDPSELEEEEARCASRIERALVREATARTGDRLFGLHAIQGAPPRFLGVFETLCATAGGVREVLGVAARYMALHHSGLSLQFEEQVGQLILRPRFSDASGEPNFQIDLWCLAGLTIMLQACTGRRARALRVGFPHPAPTERAHLEELERFFGTRRLEFDAPQMLLAFPEDLLDWSGLAPAPRVHRILSEHADQLLGALPENSAFLRRARQHLLGALQDGDASVSGLAARLRLDRRTMQRRLEAQGSSFSVLLESLRRDLATRYLQDDAIALSEVAFRLGFTSPQSFHRAFRTWTGTPPGRWRRERITGG